MSIAGGSRDHRRCSCYSTPAGDPVPGSEFNAHRSRCAQLCLGSEPRRGTTRRPVIPACVMHDYVTGVMTQFRNDSRVLGWDLWNELTTRRHTYRQVERKAKSDIVAELLPQVFQWGETSIPYNL